MYAKTKDEAIRANKAVYAEKMKVALVRVAENQIKQWLQSPKPSLFKEVVIVTAPEENSPKLTSKTRAGAFGFQDLLEAGKEIATALAPSAGDFQVRPASRHTVAG